MTIDQEPAGTVEFDLDDLTLGELEDLETHIGIPAQTLIDRFAAGEISAAMMIAVIWVIGRRTDPDLTVDDVRAYSLTEMAGVIAPAPLDGAPGANS